MDAIADMRHGSFRLFAILTCCSLAGSCNQDTTPDEVPWSDTSPHDTRFVSVDGLRLQVFDWGGSGEPLLLIHGAGVTPHYFDGLAPRLTNRFHVMSFARRGHGQSGTPSQGFVVDVLAEDLRQVMDSLGLAQAVLLGHSFGGNEITRFAALHPARVRGIIYLDAHFERFDSPWLAADDDRPQVPPCAGPETATIDEYRDCVSSNLLPGEPWPNEMEALIRDMVVEGSSNPLRFRMDLQPATGSSMPEINKDYRREYDRLGVPVLVMMADAYYPQAGADSALDRRLAEWNQRTFKPAQEWTANRFREAIPDVRVVTLSGTSHFGVVVQATDRIVQEIMRFADGLAEHGPTDESGAGG